MANNTEVKIRKLEGEIQQLWQIVNDEIFWHPTVVREIKHRSVVSRRNFKKLRTADEVLALHKSR